jgi:5-methylcytosine-specific restriction endonuclease McrA
VVEPLSPARYKVQFTASAELRDKLERLVALMRSEVPDGDLGAIVERAVSEKLERLEARRYAQTSAPRKTLAETDTKPASRHIPAAVRRAVRERDGDRCRYVDQQGRRCSARERLEFHHLHPFGLGGDHSPGNLRLLCKRHNLYLAERDYGQAAIRRHQQVRSEAPA